MLNLDKNKKYILGLSGGPDSIFLLSNLSKKINNNNIIACHINYNFRKDSYIDQQICIKICKELNVKLEIKEVNIDYALLKENFESWARELRYNFFLEIAQKNNVNNLLIAHNLNDHIETFLMQEDKKNLVSYYGIKQITKYKNLTVIRPILDYKKTDILKWLDNNNIKYAIDSTNKDLKYKRNQIRNQIKENEIEKYLKQIEFKNKLLLKELEIVNSIELKNNWLNLNDLKFDLNLNQRIVFKFLQANNILESFYNIKKSRIKELLKICGSNKSYIEFKTSDFFIIKDYNYLKVVNENDFKIVYYFPNDTEFQKKLSQYKINCENKEDLIITNDWIKFKKQLLYKGKKLEKMYSDNKISYLLRYQTLLIFDKTKKNIINNII